MNGYSNKPWNKSLCNPYNMNNNSSDCDVLKYVLAIPEEPYITKITNPRESPFAYVNRLRTPIDNLVFEIYSYDYIVNAISESDVPLNVTVVDGYNGYLPDHVFTTNTFYMVRAQAINKSGVSNYGNTYKLNYLNYATSDCMVEDVLFLDCDEGLCCSNTFVCS